MHFLKSRTAATVASTLILVGGANLAAYAATGGHFLLGESNSAGRTTGLTNTGTGAVLALKGSTSAPPLTVNSSKVVAHLNADTVDGKHASAFQSRISGLVWHPLALASGVNTGCYDATASYAVQLGIVYFQGDVCKTASTLASGQVIFTLPSSIVPHRGSGTVYLTVVECGGYTGRIIIHTDGTVYLQTDPAVTADATCFASLEGVSYPIT